jgi:hypothetical protein
VRYRNRPDGGPGFVAAMEAVLRGYARPPDPARPLVCFDESGKELHGERRPALPGAPGRPARIDTGYVRQGRAKLFLWTAPHLGRREVAVTERRTNVDWAVAMRQLAEEAFPEAERIVAVLDNLNAHTLGALDEAFPPEVAERLAAKPELQYTPKQASRLNLTECELSVRRRRCLARRIPDRAAPEREVAAWTDDRNRRQRGIDRHVTTTDARTHLKRLYPVPVFDR